MNNYNHVLSRLLPGEEIEEWRGDMGDGPFACWTNTRVFMRSPDGWVDAVHRAPHWYVPSDDEGGG